MENEAGTDKKGKKHTSLLNEIFQWILTIFFAFVIVCIIHNFIFEQALVDGHSMNDTLSDRDRLFVYKTGYFFSAPQNGDIIVIQIEQGIFKGVLKYLIPFPDPEEIDYIKRVIGTPGDKIDIKDGKVYVNDKQIKETYIKGVTYPESMKFPLTVPKDKFFVLGDNREYSQDSRIIGLIEKNRIKGKALFRIFPFSSFGNIYK